MLKVMIAFLLMVSVAHADEDSVYAETARLRQYASGADESDLKVLTILPPSKTKKKKPVQQEPNEGF